MELIRLDPLVAWILRTALATLFAVAALHKIRDPRAFLETFSEYEILPRMLIVPGATALVVSEAALAVGLLADYDGVGFGLAAVSLLSIYALAISVNLMRGRRDIDCGCLGPAGRQPLSSGLVVRNGLLAAAAAATCLPVSDRNLNVVDGISLLGGLVTLVLLFNAINILAVQTWRWPMRENAS
jgi:uncharacterized membrane protein YphA (DoxX/SURF4 family)